MNKDNAKDFLPLVQALAEGKTIQLLDKDLGGKKWFDLESPDFVWHVSFYRIKPEPKKEWVRVGLWTADGVCPRFYANALRPEESWEGNKYFGGWLTDRIEYELPEGE